MDPDDLRLLYSLFETTERQAPGSPATTRRALSLLPPSRPVERVLDLGCGTGGSTLELAASPDVHVTAVDVHPPYLATLRARAAERGILERITTVEADMAQLQGVGGGFDLIWAEGSAYSIGFENALRTWRPRLRDDGCLVVTELVWFVAEPAEPARAFFAFEYPHMRDEARCVALARAAGYDALASFRLPPADWRAYYAGLEGPLRDAVANHGDRGIYATVRRERDLFDAWGEHYGYLCLVLQATGRGSRRRADSAESLSG